MKNADKPFIWIERGGGHANWYHDRTKEEMLALIRKRFNKYSQEVVIKPYTVNQFNLPYEATTQILKPSQYCFLMATKNTIIAHFKDGGCNINGIPRAPTLFVYVWKKRRTE